MINPLLVELSRLQFALTAMYHFLFVPLTLGLSILVAMMETVYVMTGRTIWRDMTKFWGLLFGINFALGVATGITMEFEFGMNWAYYSHYVGDIFGAPLAIEGLMAFFLEATFVGLFFFGWDKLSARAHLVVTWLVALGSNFSALWILIANGWMQNPVGAAFNPDTMRMEVTDFMAVLFNPTAQAKFVHTVSAGYVDGRGLRARRLGLLSPAQPPHRARQALLRDRLGLRPCRGALGHRAWRRERIHDHRQPEDEARRDGGDVAHRAGARLFHRDRHSRHGRPHDPFRRQDSMGDGHYRHALAGYSRSPASSSWSTRPRPGSRTASSPMRRCRSSRPIDSDAAARATFDAHRDDLGYALLLKRYVDDPTQATPQQIHDAAWSTVPSVPYIFFTFRFMVLFGFVLLAVFAVSLWHTAREAEAPRWLFRLALWVIPLPWLAAELGWFVAEFGRQPWIIDGVLPTFLATSAARRLGPDPHHYRLHRGLWRARGHRGAADARMPSARGRMP